MLDYGALGGYFLVPHLGSYRVTVSQTAHLVLGSGSQCMWAMLAQATVWLVNLIPP